MEQLGPIVREGTWLYGETTPVGVRIRATTVRYGTGDYEDPPDVRDDAPSAGFSVEWERAGDGGWDGGVSTAYETLDEALSAVAAATKGTVQWNSSAHR
jgi:hypothetical protein